MDLETRYQKIFNTFNALEDFSDHSLEQSRRLFEIQGNLIIPRKFEVWTCLVGLPITNDLTQAFQRIRQQVSQLLPDETPIYWVKPETYHWELFIIQRPDERVTPQRLIATSQKLGAVLSNQPQWSQYYRGFLVTPDGTIIVKGYGEFDQLRHRLHQHIPWASKRQSELGHISLGRILSPLGLNSFEKLKALVEASQQEEYGALEVHQVKYVHELQWYMEEKEIVSVHPFKP